MTLDHTQQQSFGELQKAERLSLQSTTPPAEVPGYRLERLLGQGAFGQVWSGVDLNTGRPVAIKFYLHRGSMNLPLLSREVSHLVNMSTGRHIVQVLAVGWEAEPPYYVMEYLENGSLEDLIRARGTMGVSESVEMLREIAEGLSYAHGKGVLHCDLKPANVVLDHSWRPRLADFGQGRLTNEQTPSLGTLFYMAPEQSDLAASPDVAWDVYALGAIGYTLLVGSPPHRTPSVIEQLDTASTLPDRLDMYRQTILRSPAPRIHHRRRGVDKQLALIIDKCLEVEPHKRFSNVQQFIQAIDNRQRSRLRRPLYLLGVLGPILLVLLMVVFKVRSISIATQESLQSVTQRSLESNDFAARYVAQTLETKLQALFRLVEAETRRDELRNLVSRIEESSAELLEQLADGEPHVDLVPELLANPHQQALEAYLKRRLESVIQRESNVDGATAIFNSLIVNDNRGSIISVAFSSSEEQTAKSPVGGNYAYRSYFNGNREDGDKRVSPNNFAPLRTTRLSASFRSTATGAWKVGVSAPIWNADAFEGDGDVVRPDAQPIGVLVLTINLGDFELLSQSHSETEASSATTEEGLPRFAALVDGRAGNQKGTLLQHPLINSMDRETMKTVLMPQINTQMLERLQKGIGVSDYHDPAAEFDNGEPYKGVWLASLEQVSLPHVIADSQEVRTKSDLWILVQERSDSVSAPIRSLATQLQLESLVELVVLLFVIIIMWYFVLRIGQATFEKSNVASASMDTALQSTVESDR